MPFFSQKNDMARLIALYNAGAKEEVNQLLADFRNARSRSRRYALAYGAHPGYITTTAEADSASANPDLRDDDLLLAPTVSIISYWHSIKPPIKKLKNTVSFPFFRKTCEFLSRSAELAQLGFESVACSTG